MGGGDIYWRRGLREGQVLLMSGGMVVLVVMVISSALGQVEFGMPVCHPKFH